MTVRAVDGTGIAPGAMSAGWRYVGLDAAIDEGGPDLVFVNNGPGFLYVHMRTDGTRLHVDLYGPPPGWDVAVSEHWRGNARPTTGRVQHYDESSLPAGQVVLAEEARDGFDARVTRVVSKDGRVIDRQTFGSSYIPTDTVYLNGTGGRG